MKIPELPPETASAEKKEFTQSISIESQYKKNAYDVPLLSKQEEQLLAAKVKCGNEARTKLLDILEPILLENIQHPEVQSIIQRLREEVPSNYKEYAEQNNLGVDFRNVAETNGHIDGALLVSAFDVCRSKFDLFKAFQGGSNNRLEATLTLLKMSKILESTYITTAKKLAESKVVDLIEAKEALIKDASQAREHFCMANLRLVMKIAGRFRNFGLQYEDLVEEGNIGLMRAVEGFDGELGFKFSTYATNWIDQAVRRALANQSEDIRIPVHVRDMVIGFKQRLEQLEIKEGRKIAYIEGMNLLKYSKREQATMDEAFRAIGAQSLEDKFGSDDDDQSVGTAVYDKKTDPPDADMVEEYREAEIRNTYFFIEKFLQKLVEQGEIRPRDAELASLRLGLGGKKKMNQAELGKYFKFTRSRAQQIEVAVFSKLDRAMRLEEAKRKQLNWKLQNKFAKYRKCLELIESLLVQRASKNRDAVPEEEQETVANFISDAFLADQEKDILIKKLGLNGAPMTFVEIGKQYGGLTRERIRQILAGALEWMHDAVEGKHLLDQMLTQRIESDLGTVGSADQMTLVLRRARDLVSSTKEVKPVLDPKEMGSILHIRSQDGFLRLDSLTTITDELDDDHDEENRRISAIKEFLSDGVQEAKRDDEDEQCDVLNELFSTFNDEKDPYGKYPSWMKMLNEATATRLHSMLIGPAVSDKDVETFFVRAGFEGKKLQQACRDCIVFDNIYESKLRDWIQSLHVKPHKPGEFIRNVSFLHLAEREKVLIPNAQLIINRHFEDSDIPPEERSILMVGANWSTSALENMFGDVANMSIENLRKSMQWADIGDDKYDVILLNHLPNVLRFEEDERALLWAQDHLKKGGISISIMHDRAPVPATREHMRKELGVHTRGPFLPRYTDYLRGRGVSVEVARPSLQISSVTGDGHQAMKDVMGFMLPNRTKIDDGILDEYIARYVAKGDAHEFKETFAFMIAYENSAVNLQPEFTRLQQAVEEREIPVENRHENLINVHKKDGERVRYIRNNDVMTPSKPTTFKPVMRSIEEIDNTHATDTLEFKKIRGRLERLFYGPDHKKGCNQLGGKGKLFRSKKWFRKQDSVPMEKANRNYKAQAEDLNTRLIQMRERNICAVNEKTGEITINGTECVRMKSFAGLHALDEKLLEGLVRALGIEPHGRALEMNSSESALQLGFRTKVYELATLKSIPYVRQKIEEEHNDLLSELASVPVRIPPTRGRFSALLKELDEGIDMESIDFSETPKKLYGTQLSDPAEATQKRSKMGIAARGALASYIVPEIFANKSDENLLEVVADMNNIIAVDDLYLLIQQFGIEVKLGDDDIERCISAAFMLSEHKILLLEKLAIATDESEIRDLLILIEIADKAENSILPIGKGFVENNAKIDWIEAKATLGALAEKEWKKALPERLV